MTTIFMLMWIGVALIVAALFGTAVQKMSKDGDHVDRIRKAGF